MARARNIKPSFFRNEDLAELAFEIRLLFIGLWTLADREGRMEDRPKRIKMELFPADDVDVDAGLSALESYGFLVRYKVDGRRFIHVINFVKHQVPHHKETESEIPPPPGQPAITRHQHDVPESVRQSIFARDDHRCLKCGTHDDLSIDHIVPLARGGSSDARNLQTLCTRCNAAKGATSESYVDTSARQPCHNVEPASADACAKHDDACAKHDDACAKHDDACAKHDDACANKVAPCPTDSLILNPESPILNPESPIPNPDSEKRAVPPPHACAHEEAPAVRAGETREVQGGSEAGPPVGHARLSAQLRADRVQATPAIVEAWLAEGADAAQILHAAGIARSRKPPPQRIPATYLTPIIADLKTSPRRGNAERSGHRRLSAAEQATADAERFERAQGVRETERDISGHAQRVD